MYNEIQMDWQISNEQSVFLVPSGYVKIDAMGLFPVQHQQDFIEWSSPRVCGFHEVSW